MKPHIVAFIFARGGSKGVPRKNLRLLAGKPLIAHTIEIALTSDYIDRVIVSTDSHEIAQVAQQFGAEVPFMRPAELATDDSPELLSWKHAVWTLDTIEDIPPVDVFVCVPPTAPLRAVEDVDTCIKALLESDADFVITVKEANRSPYFNMVTLDENACAQLVISPSETIYRRQDVPAVYDMTTVAYVTRPAYILKIDSYFEGKVNVVVVPEERALDIDTELDFKIAEMMLSELSSNGECDGE